MSTVSFKNSSLGNRIKYGSFLAGNDFTPSGAFDLIEEQTLVSPASSVEFTNLDTTYSGDYQHLQIRVLYRSARANDIDGVNLRLNSDSGANYTRHKLTGDGTGLSSDGFTGLTNFDCGGGAADNENSGVFSPHLIDLLDAFSTAKNTTIRGFSGVFAETGSARTLVQYNTGAYLSNSAVNAVQIFAASGNLLAGSRVSLYGIRTT